MSAYLTTLIYGNENFGGYFAVDGDAARPVEHDMTYQLNPGPHHIDFYSTSNAQRKAGAVQAHLYCKTSSSGVILDAIERRQALNNLGDSWSIDVFVDEDQLLILSVQTSGNSIVAGPFYKVEDLDDDEIETLEAVFEQMEQEAIAEANRPKRKPAKIVWGIILMILGCFGAAGYYGTGAYLSGEYEWYIPVIAFGGLLIGGALLFINGIRKKVRK